jgi:prepilin-type N-terminal cleavage/methylation domain-containing protein
MNIHANTRLKETRRRRWGFSMVEMIACVSIIGIVAFLAIPSVTRMRGDSERNLAIARAEALNLAQATLVQVRGRSQAATDWNGASTAEAKYNLLKPYLAYSENTLALFMPEGYAITFSPDITRMIKNSLRDPNNSVIFY